MDGRWFTEMKWHREVSVWLKRGRIDNIKANEAAGMTLLGILGI